jgi:type I thyroxine 5'-deiodinase
MVYIEEAHASDLWQAAENVRQKILISSPRSYQDRLAAAGSCVVGLKIEFPTLVDELGNAVESAYTAWPDRIYVIDRAGKIAWKSRPGPYGFQAQPVADALAKLSGAS